jgi:HPt (histidine-containing phosphotransfer) domain-containing protein
MPMDPTQAGPTLRSEFADDPEMADLVELFTDELPKRITALHEAVARADHAALQRLAHQLKGAAPGYGYPTIGQAAARVENPLRDAADPAAALESVKPLVDHLVTVCRSAIG